MGNLITPFGEINILADGNPIPYTAQELFIPFSFEFGSYKITVPYIPDGEKHRIACIFEPNCSFDRELDGKALITTRLPMGVPAGSKMFSARQTCLA